MKTEFELVWANDEKTSAGYNIRIVGDKPFCKPYVTVRVFNGNPLFIKKQDMERFAVNILKSIKSKRLKK